MAEVATAYNIEIVMVDGHSIVLNNMLPSHFQNAARLAFQFLTFAEEKQQDNSPRCAGSTALVCRHQHVPHRPRRDCARELTADSR